jgi:hypothetical protein
MIAREAKRSVIENWMRSSIQDGGIERFDDLHIDQIDPMWRSRSSWIAGALQAYGLAVELRDRFLLDIVVALAFSLRSGEGALGVNFGTLSELEKELDWSPPSLYLFHRGQEPWRASPPAQGVAPVAGLFIQRMDAPSLFGTAVRASECYFLEFKDLSSDEYSRTLFLAG